MGASVDDLRLRYLDKELVASEDTPTQYTASGGSLRTAIAAALSGLTNIEGAIIRWDEGDNADAYQWSAVNAFDDGTDTLTFDTDLPYAVASGDKFTMFAGGNYESDQDIPGMSPNAGNFDPTNCTGLQIVYISMMNGVGSGTLSLYDNGGSPDDYTATWTPPSGTEGTAIDISALTPGQQVTLIGGGTGNDDLSKYIILERTAASYPTGNKTDVLVLTIPLGVFMMPLVAAETGSGVTIYRPVGIKNASSTGTIYGAKAWVPNPYADDGASESTVSGSGIGTGSDTLVVADATNWPTSLWVGKTDGSDNIVDVRYCYGKSGNSYEVMDPSGGMRGYTAASWSNGNPIVPLAWQDIGLDAPDVSSSPATYEFVNPTDENTAPAGVTFTTNITDDTGLSIGDLAASAVYCIWERFEIPAGIRPLSSVIARLNITAEVSE